MKIFEQTIDWGQAETDQNKIDQSKQTIVKTKTNTPTPTPIPKPKPTTTTKQDIITGDQYILKKDHVIEYVAGSADTFLKNMFKWFNEIRYSGFGGGGETNYDDAMRDKWFTKKTITIPKGTIVYIHYNYVVMIVNDTKTTPENYSWKTNLPVWRITYNYKDKTLKTSSYYDVWKEYWKDLIQYPSFQEQADDIGIDDIKYVSPKYRNDELIGFLRTLDPVVQAERKYIQNLSKIEKQELNKKFYACLNIIKAYYTVLEKKPKPYFGKFKEDEDYKGASRYFDLAVHAQFNEKLAWINKTKNSNLKDNLNKLDSMHVGVQNYLGNLYQGNSVQPPVFKFILKHPYDKEQNVKVNIHFNYFDE